MVGRSSRRHVYKEDEEEFESIAYINNKKKVKMSQNAEEDKLLAGIDLDGCSEQEKEDIRRALLESKNQVYIQPHHEDEQKPGPSSTCRDTDEQSSPSDIFGGSDNNDDDAPVPAAAANDSDDDDNETQPPESMDMGTFNLVEPTLVDLDDDTEDMMIDDKHSTHCDDSPTSHNNAEKEEHDSTQSFSPEQDIETDKKNNANSRPSTSASNSSQIPGPSSNLSQDTKQNQNFNKTTGSSSQDEVEIDDVHVPLRRHYRVVSTQTSKTDDFFSKDGVVTESSVKAICQLFDIFRMKLKKAQEKCREKISWGEPVKPGSHQSETVDVKRRGHDSICIGLSSDEDNDFKSIPEVRQSRRPGLRARKTRSYSAIKTPSDSDDDLPDLITEDVVAEKRSKFLRERSSRRKGLLSTAKERNQKKSESSPDFNLDSDDNAFETVGRKTFEETNNDDGKLNSNDIHKKDNSSLHNKTKKLKNVVAMETKDDNISERILVEETQDQDLNLKEITKEMKEVSMITVAETQVDDDDDINWLQAEKSHSVKNSHTSKVRDYAHKKVAHSKVNKKGATALDKFVNQHNDVNVAGNIVNLDNSSDDDAKEDLYGNSDKNTKSDKKRSRVKKRKADVDEDPVLIKQTQGNSDVDNVESKRGRKGVKRKCYQLDSGSSPEIVSVADSQDEAESMEPKKIGEDQVNLNDIGKETRNNDLNDDVNETCNKDQEDSQSPVIKRSKKSTLKGEGMAGTNKKNLFSKTGKDREETLNERKQRSVRTNRSNIKRDLLQNDSEFKTGKSEMHNLPKGAQNFLSRPISVESIESKSSDDISMTSSQRSGMIIDEQGDLYSTQFCEIKDRKRKATPSSTFKSSLLSEKMDAFDEVMRLEEPASVGLSKENNKDNIKSDRKGKAAPTGRRKLFKKTKLDKFVISEGTSTDLPIKLDSDSDDQVTNMKENNKDKVKKSRRMPRDKTKTNKHIDKDTDLELEVDPSDLNHKREATETRRNKAATSNTRSVKKSRIKAEDQIKVSDHDVYDIDDVESDGGNNAEDDIAEAGERGRTDAEAYLQRFENISERNSSNNASTHAQLMTGGEASGRKRRQYEDYDNNETAQNKVETIPCPLCNQLFPKNIIEDHAADCNGPVTQEDDQSKSPPLNIRHEHENTPEVEQTDSVKHNFMVHNTDQQESEVKTCWICERVIKEQYELHVDRCYKEAEKRQRAMEENGYKEPAEVEIEQRSPARTTRSRFRQHETEDNPFVVTTYAKPRRVVNNVNVGPDKDEREVTPTRQGRNITRRKGERIGTARSATATEGQQ